MANYPEKAFSGSAQTLINTATDIAAGNFSGAPAANFDPSTDTTVPYSRYVELMIEMPDWAAAPVAGTPIDFFALMIDVDGTDDDTDAPSGTASGGAIYMGSVPAAAADALQRRTLLIDLSARGVSSVRSWALYIRNGTAQNMNNDAGTNCVVKATPVSFGITV